MKNHKETNTIGWGYSSLFTLIFTLVFFFSASAYAYNPPDGVDAEDEEEIVFNFPYEDEQLLAFFDSNREISSLQRDTQEKIEETLSNHNLTSARFGQIGRAAQIGALAGGTFTQEEIDAFNTAAPQVTSIQREQQSQMQTLLADNGLSTQLYQEIMNKFRSDQQLQEYVRNLARDRAIELAREERRQQRELEAQEGAETE